MPIKKRSSAPIVSDDQPELTGLVIVAKPKKPIPPDGIIRRVFGEKASAQQVRRIGPIAIDCKELPDAGFTIEDRVTAMRTPYDPKNTQEIRYRNRVRNRATAITAMCITCQGGRKAVTECLDTQCPLWPFRFGGDPFFGKKGK
jgi:hypothetical protein